MQGWTYTEALNYIYSLQKFGIKFGLSKTENILKAFGDPHKEKIYIHIAGTNGKGSVAVFLASVLKEAGYRVGLYTSPHLVRFTERFRINGEEIKKEEAAELIFELRKSFSPKEPPTFFEAATAMAIIYFACHKTDIDIMEVGMGGRLDATNVIHPVVSVITNIGLDHQQYLGSRLIDIAKEKAGIIKNGVELVTGVTQPELVSFFKEVADHKDAPFFRVGKDMKYRSRNGLIDYYGIKTSFRGLKTGMNGLFQARNAAISLGVLELLREKGFKIEDIAIYNGIRKAFWPGRMHMISDSPLIILDGAHNPYAMKMLCKAIEQKYPDKRIILVLGIMKDKNIKAMLRTIIPKSNYVIYTRPVYSRAAEPELLERYGAQISKKGEVVPRLTEAIERAKNIADSDDLILITGSLFTVGEALAYLDPKNYFPDKITE